MGCYKGATCGATGCYTPWGLQAIERAFHAGAALAQNVSVNHGGGDILVAEEFLDRPDVGAALEGVGCEAVTKGV